MIKIEVTIEGTEVRLSAPGAVSSLDMIRAAYIVLSGAVEASRRCDCVDCRSTRRVALRLKGEIHEAFSAVVCGDPDAPQAVGRA